MRKHLLIWLMSLYIFVLGSTKIFAAAPVAAPPRFGELQVVFTNAINGGLVFASIVAVAMVIFAGYTYMISQGDAQKMQRAQGTITWVVIGIIFLAVSGFAINGLLDLFGVATP